MKRYKRHYLFEEMPTQEHILRCGTWQTVQTSQGEYYWLEVSAGMNPDIYPILEDMQAHSDFQRRQWIRQNT